MSIRIMLVDSAGKTIGGIPDPWGSQFNAAGDFDRLIGDAHASPVWSSLDPYGAVSIDRQGAQNLLNEIPNILKMAKPGVETRGLQRLQILVQICASSEALILRAVGD